MNMQLAFWKRVSLLALLAVYFVLFWMRMDNAYTERCFHAVLTSKLENNVPAGEILSGFHLMQPINWSLLEEGALERDASNTVCVSVLLANYGDRQNDGTFALSLQAYDKTYRVIVEAKTVRDCVYNRVCFKGVTLGSVAHKPAALFLEGVDGKPGRSITAWMTAYTAHGAAVLRNGSTSGRSLTFRIEVARSLDSMRNQVYILMLLFGLSSVVILFASLVRNTETPPQRLKSDKKKDCS